MAGTVRHERVGSYNQTVGVRLDIDDAIDILTPTDVPLQQWAGTGEAATQPKVEWLEEDLTPQHVTVVSETATSGAGDVVVDDASPIRPGDVLMEVDAAYTKQFLVTAVDQTTNTLTVSGFAGNTADPTVAATLQVIGQYRTEGGDPEDPRSIERTIPFNYTQIGQEQISVTRTGRKRGLYGQGDPYDHEVMKKFKELAIRFERSMVNGYRTQSGDATKRMMGGLFFYISTNTESGVKANTSALVNSLAKKTYEQGGTPTVLMVSPAVKVCLSGIDPTLRRSDRSDRTAGSVVEKVLTDFGEFDVVVNRHFPKTKGLMLQGEYIKKRPFDAYFHELLAKTGDSEKGEIVGEYSLEVKNEKAHGLLTITDA
jgi:hypothetical protein